MSECTRKGEWVKNWHRASNREWVTEWQRSYTRYRKEQERDNESQTDRDHTLDIRRYKKEKTTDRLTEIIHSMSEGKGKIESQEKKSQVSVASVIRMRYSHTEAQTRKKRTAHNKAHTESLTTCTGPQISLAIKSNRIAHVLNLWDIKQKSLGHKKQAETTLWKWSQYTASRDFHLKMIMTQQAETTLWKWSWHTASRAHSLKLIKKYTKQRPLPENNRNTQQAETTLWKWSKRTASRDRSLKMITAHSTQRILFGKNRIRRDM